MRDARSYGEALARLFGPGALRYRLADSGARLLFTDGDDHCSHCRQAAR